MLYFAVEDVQGRDDFEEEAKEEVDGFYVRRRSKRAVSLMKHIEVLLVADYSLTKYYSHRDLESYLFTIMNMVRYNYFCNGQFQCLAKFLLKHEKQNPSPQLKRSYQK